LERRYQEIAREKETSGRLAEVTMSETEQQLVKLCADLFEKVSEVSLRFDALRLILERADPELHTHFERELLVLKTIQRARLEQQVDEVLKQQETERMRQLLDSHEGNKQ
jgi:hypothetical protein